MKTLFTTFITDQDLQDEKMFLLDNYNENEITDNMLYQAARDTKDLEYEDFMSMLDEYSSKNPIRLYKIEGSLGLWNGRHKIQPCYEISLKRCIEKTINSDINDVEILEDRGRLFVKAYHHDGTNEFTITIKHETKAYFKNINLSRFIYNYQ